MFEKLKKLIFDETIELEPQEDEIAYEIQDSLENNKNLVKTKPISKPVETFNRKIEKVPVESYQEPVLNQKVEEVENVFKRIDVDETKLSEQQSTPINETIVEKVEEIAKPIERVVEKPVSKAIRNKTKNPQYYRPRAVISPMFGVSREETERTQQIKTLSKPEEPSEAEKIISPMYGKLTAEQEIVTKHSKPTPRKRKATAVNMSLEEMLNLESSDEIEFTLFDVKVDKNEFQSRDNKKIDDNELN